MSTTAIYYTNEDGAITHYYLAPPDMARGPLETAAQDYNNQHTGLTAHLLDVPADSLLEFVICAHRGGVRYTEETIKEAERALEDALSAIRDLTPAKCQRCTREEQQKGGANGKE